MADFKCHDHASLFYSSKEERLPIVSGYMKDGLKLGERCVYIFHENGHDFILERLKVKGVKVDSALKKGDLLLLDKKEAYLRRDFFDPDYTVKKLRQFTDLAISEGYKGLRITSEMSWANGDYPGSEKLMEYEAKLNFIIPRNKITALCQYDINSFQSGSLIRAIQTHPVVVFNNIPCKNGYYVPPSEFLRNNHTDCGAKRRLKKNLHKREFENVISNGVSVEIWRNRMLDRQVNEWEKALEVFKESESYFRNLVNSAPVALIMTDTSGRCLFANEHWQMLSGLTLQESIGIGWQKVIYPDDVGKIGSWWYRGEKKPADPETECRICSIEGRKKRIALKSSPLYDDNGSMIGFIAAFSEIVHHMENEHTFTDKIIGLRNPAGYERSKSAIFDQP
ncbi:MAG: MEDS domain-containing protein [Candidatus Zixiibacteriota bacterium]|nr:MAG: MEDS domain-containing protein [candidate division Zixibacteria bacterium]